MDWLYAVNLKQFLLFTLVLSRISGLMMATPIYGGQEVPVRVRAMLVLAIAMVIAPTQWQADYVFPGTVIDLSVVLLGELLVGLLLGVGVTIFFVGFQLAGQIVAQVSGMALANVIDPSSGSSVAIFGQVLYLLAVVIFAILGGHRMVMAGLLDTFMAIPPGSGGITGSLGDSLATLLTQSYSLGIRVAAPSLTAQMLSTLVFGLIGRTLPQLNILAVGFGIKSLVALGTLAVSLGSLGLVLDGQVEPLLSHLVEMIDTAALSR